MWTRSYNDHEVPADAPKDISSRVRRLKRPSFDILVGLFEKRPVWLRSALKHYLPDMGTGEFRA